MSQPH